MKIEVIDHSMEVDQKSGSSSRKKSVSPMGTLGELTPKRLIDGRSKAFRIGSTCLWRHQASKKVKVIWTAVTELQTSLKLSIFSMMPVPWYRSLMPVTTFRAAYSTSSATSAGEAGRSSERLRGLPGVRELVTSA